MRPPKSRGKDAAAIDKQSTSVRAARFAVKNLFEDSPDGILVLDTQGVIRDANPRAEELFGYTAAELKGQPVRILIPQRFHPRHSGHMENYNKDPSLHPMGPSLSPLGLRKDGTEFPVNVMLKPIQTRSGAVVLGFVRDVSEQRRAHDELAAVVTTMAEGLIVRQADGRVTSCNDSAERLLGMTRSDLIGRTLPNLELRYVRADGSLLPIDEHPSMVALRTGMPVRNMRMGIRKADESVTWIQSNSEPMFQQGEKTPYAVVTTFLDDTVRRDTESNLSQAADYTRSLIEASLDPLVAISPDGKITDVNSATETAIGLPRASLIGSDFSDYFTEPEKARIAYQQAVQFGSLHNYPLVIRHVTGATTDVLYNASIFKDSSGQVKGVFAAARDVTDRRRAEAKILELAFYDPLTRLPNRRLLMDRLSQALAGCARTGRYSAMVFIDLDDFKSLNDTLGHDAGDRMLIQVAGRLSGSLRSQDTVARFGGDEFVVLLPELSSSHEEALHQTSVVGQKLLQLLDGPYLLAGQFHRCSGSLGVTLFNNAQHSPDELLKHADIAMYQAKAAGKRTVRFFNPEMQTEVVKRVTLDQDLQAALAEKALVLHYEPQVDREKRLIGAEALLRWQHPSRGLLQPSEFIRQAEEKDYIDSFGRWVLDEVCKLLHAWGQTPETERLRLAMNVSPHEFRKSDFASRALEVMRMRQVNPRRLVLELTENATLEALSDTITKMEQLRSQGVILSLDDFGVGYASLSHLKDLPLDQLKVDRHFVKTMLVSPRDARIVAAMVALGRSLQLDVIAEGVETEEQMRFLENEGCLFFQGYLFGRAGPLENLFRGRHS